MEAAYECALLVQGQNSPVLHCLHEMPRYQQNVSLFMQRSSAAGTVAAFPRVSNSGVPACYSSSPGNPESVHESIKSSQKEVASQCSPRANEGKVLQNRTRDGSLYWKLNPKENLISRVFAINQQLALVKHSSPICILFFFFPRKQILTLPVSFVSRSPFGNTNH